MAKKTQTGSFEWGHDPDYFKTARPNGPLAGLEVGKVVVYAKYHLKTLGAGPTNDLWRLEGRVVELAEEGAFKGWPRVLWADREEPVLVNPSALAFPGANLRRLE